MRQLVTDDEGKLRVGLRQRGDAGIDHDAVVGGVGVDAFVDDVLQGNGAGHHRPHADRAVDAVAAQIDAHRLCAVGLQPAPHPARRAGERDQFAVERDDLVMIADARLRRRRAVGHRDDRRAHPGEIERLGGERLKAARQAARRHRGEADLRRDSVLAEAAVGDPQPERDVFDAVDGGVVATHLRDLLAALLGRDRLCIKLGQARDRCTSGQRGNERQHQDARRYGDTPRHEEVRTRHQPLPSPRSFPQLAQPTQAVVARKAASTGTAGRPPRPQARTKSLRPFHSFRGWGGRRWLRPPPC